jgi:hypothetical protein
VRIARELNGPPDAGHGGYVAGSLAVGLPGPGADVWLRAPAPLEVDLEERVTGEHIEIWRDDQLIAEADSVDVVADPIPFVALPQAQAAQQDFAGSVPNRYETCFGCGRLRDDGLGIHPGPVRDGLVACVWHPRGRIAPEWIWTALDCASGWAWPIGSRSLVTGRLAGGLLMDPPFDPAGPYVVVGAQLGQEGRKYFSGSALFTASGQRVAALRATWIDTA